MALCLLPLLGMLVYPTTRSTDNRPPAEPPLLRNLDGKPNLDFFRDFESWFGDRFAFRNELVFADSTLQSKVFHVSAVESVIRGKDGWLFYASTLDDYLGRRPMSERELHNLAHNLSLVSRYVESRNSRFLLCVPPNKNTLYGDWMPDWAVKAAAEPHDMERLAPLLREKGVAYADLLGFFRSQDEILYLKRDSHWNDKGAVLAAAFLLNELGCAHEDFAAAPVSRARDNDGDLNRMLYTFYGEPSVNYHYSFEQRYRYADPDADVEDGWIETEGGNGNSSLLMLRDSFGNTLIPLLANQFESAAFGKEVPFGLEPRMDQCSPAYVVFEKAERNLREFITDPPILILRAEAPAAEPIRSDARWSIRAAVSDYDRSYLMLSGEIEASALQAQTEILIRIDGECFDAYHIGENGFLVYCKRDELRLPTHVELLLVDNGVCRALPTQEVNDPS